MQGEGILNSEDIQVCRRLYNCPEAVSNRANSA